MKQFRVALIASLTAISGVALAATDGAVGTTSDGTSILTVTKENVVQITGIGDIAFGTLGFIVAPEVATEAMCVYSSSGTYNITVSSANGSFAMEAGVNSVQYSVTWNAAALTYNTVLTGQTGSPTDPTCGGIDNATLEVTLSPAAFNAAAAGSYTDTLTLAVAPE